MHANDEPLNDAAAVAVELARGLDQCNQECSLGGAIALAYWAAPRGTMDVDPTIVEKS